MIGPIDDYWGKLERDADDAVVAWHPLWAHSADVAAVTESLLRHSVVGRRLARIGGVSELHPVNVARLAFIAALHDIGKFNHGFQAKSHGGGVRAGHVAEIVALLGSECAEKNCLLDALDIDRMLRWASDPEELGHVLVASFAHHGKPTPVGTRAPNAALWRHRPGVDGAAPRDPFHGMARLVKRARTWFPSVDDDRVSLPTAPPFQHAVNGLVTLADWIASDTQFFPYAETASEDRFTVACERAAAALRALGIDTHAAAARASGGRSGFAALVPEGLEPRPAQRAMDELQPDARGSLAILEASTGSGKTEAALAFFLRRFDAGDVDGLYFALPTRTAATQIHARVVRAVARAFPSRTTRPAVVLAVPGYLAVDDDRGQRLARFEVLWNDDDPGVQRPRRWAAENPKRYLAAAIGVGTIDQLLLSALRVPHAHMRAVAALRHLLVVDEVHASDAYMTRILDRVLRRHVGAGGHALLLSATLGAVARERFLGRRSLHDAPVDLARAIAVPYPSLHVRGVDTDGVVVVLDRSLPSRTIGLALLDVAEYPLEVARTAIAAARRGARVLVVRNTVRDCLATQGALEREAAGDDSLLFRCRGVITPHHARYARADRKALDEALEHALGRERGEGGLVVVATQTVQQSLDIDADLLLSDICPADVLLQRIGRLHRHEREGRPPGCERPHVVVLTPAERNLAERIRKGGRAAGTLGLGSVYEDLRIIEATWRALSDRDVLRLPDENRELVERSTHPEALAQLVQDVADDDEAVAWRAHAQAIDGAQFADRGLAGMNTVDWTLPFGEPNGAFGNVGERIRTRLGEGDRLVRFDDAMRSPFGLEFSILTLAAWLAGDVPDDAQPTDVQQCGAGVRFRFGGRSFAYDRLGLRTAATEDVAHG